MVIDQSLINSLERERLSLKRYYWWQVGLGAVFLILIFLSSFFIGFRSERFWIYIVIPLIVAGSFWIYIVSTKQSVERKLTERALKLLVPQLFPEWKYFPVFKIDRRLFDEALFIPKVDEIITGSAVTGLINQFATIIVELKADLFDRKEDFFVFSGIFISFEFKYNIPEFGVYPKRQNLEWLKNLRNFKEINVKLSSEFKVIARNDIESTKIDYLGPVIMKFAQQCTDDEKFYLTTFNNRLNIGLNDFSSLAEFSLDVPLTEHLIIQSLNKLKNCINFISEFEERIKQL